MGNKRMGPGSRLAALACVMGMGGLVMLAAPSAAAADDTVTPMHHDDSKLMKGYDTLSGCQWAGRTLIITGAADAYHCDWEQTAPGGEGKWFLWAHL